MDTKHRSGWMARWHLLASSTNADKLPSRTIMLFTNIVYQPRSWTFQPWSIISIRNQKEERNNRRLDFEVLRRREERDTTEQDSLLMANETISAPSTPKKKQHALMTKPFSNTINPWPNSTFHHKQTNKLWRNRNQRRTKRRSNLIQLRMVIK
jgi:hypothetical protein